MTWLIKKNYLNMLYIKKIQWIIWPGDKTQTTNKKRAYKTFSSTDIILWNCVIWLECLVVYLHRINYKIEQPFSIFISSIFIQYSFPGLQWHNVKQKLTYWLLVKSLRITTLRVHIYINQTSNIAEVHHASHQHRGVPDLHAPPQIISQSYR